MNQALVDQIANAVLYEGYLLYPYRPSVKNRQRWTFGGLYPRSYSEALEGAEPWANRTECLVEGGAGARLGVRVRFLQLQSRTTTEGPNEGAWQEAVERDMDAGEWDLAALADAPRRCEFTFPGCRMEEAAREPVGIVRREQQTIVASVALSADRAADGLFRVSIRVENHTPFEPSAPFDRDAALLRALVSSHTVLSVQGGEFVSLIDPPERWRTLAAGCCNVGTWPVLVGEPGEPDTMLSAPIILYDYPQIAPESPGDLFDSTEIDEILTLRILTLTDDEKRAVAAVDDRARALLERTEAIARGQLMGLHGTMRGLKTL